MVFIPMILLFVIGIGAYFILKHFFNKQHLLKDGIQTSAKVLTITQTIAQVNSSDPAELPKRVYEIDFGIQAEGEPYRIVTVRKAFASGERMPQQDEEVILLIDPKNPDNAMISLYQRRGE